MTDFIKNNVFGYISSLNHNNEQYGGYKSRKDQYVNLKQMEDYFQHGYLQILVDINYQKYFWMNQIHVIIKR